MTGKRLEQADALQTLSQEQAVVLFTEGDKIDHFYRTLLRPETLVVVLPKE